MVNKRTDKIVALAKQKSEDKLKLVLSVIEEMSMSGETINFNSVHVRAGVTKAYLYNNQQLRETIISIRDGHENNIADEETAETVVAALQCEIKRLRKQLKELQHDETWKAKYEKMLESRNFYKDKYEHLLGEKHY